MLYGKYVDVAYLMLGVVMLVVATLFGIAWVLDKVRRRNDSNSDKSRR